MRYAIAILTLVASTTFGAALESTASIVSSWPSPCTGLSAYGIDYGERCNGNYIYHTDAESGYLYETTLEGVVVNGYPEFPNATDVDKIFDGVYPDDELWASWVDGVHPGRVCYLKMNGSIISSFTGPATGLGIAVDANGIWYSTGSTIYNFEWSGSLLTSFLAPNSNAVGLCYDHPCLYTTDTGSIYRITTTGSVLSSFPAPGETAGITLGGGYIWCATSDKYVYKIAVSDLAVAPASLGRVRGIFR